MTAKILLFPAQRIRRLTCSGGFNSDMLLVSMTSNIPRVEHNQSIPLLYAIFDGAKRKLRAKPGKN